MSGEDKPIKSREVAEKVIFAAFQILSDNGKEMPMRDLISLVEKSASSDVYSVLKREDEKYVTERAYNNPMFVEDVVRDIAEKLNQDTNITWFAVESENFESIHNHNAYAYIEKHKTGG